MAPRKRKAEDGGGGTTTQKVRRAAPNGVSPRITRNMTTDGPRKAVFDTAELLENILLHAPPKTVIAAQRVCHQFQDIVMTSARLQQWTFLRPLTQPVEHWLVEESPGLGGWPRDHARYSFTVQSNIGSQDSGTQIVMPVRLHPSLFRRLYESTSPNSASRLWGTLRESLRFSIEKPLDNAASWMNAYLTDPPCTKVSFWFVWQLKCKPPIRGLVTREAFSATGLKFRDLVDAVLYQKGDVTWYVKNTTSRPQGVSLADLLAKFEQQYGKATMFTCGDTRVRLEGVVAPSEQEWKRMREHGHSRDAVEKTGAGDGII